MAEPSSPAHPQTSGRPRVVVIGAGVAGLTAAWSLHQSHPHWSVTVLEASHEPGGKIAEGEVAGVVVETGPDSFLARVPHATELCRRLGLGEELVAPATSRAYLLSRGRLRALPAGLVLGVPARLGPLNRSGIVSPAGMLRAAADLVLPGGGARRPAVVGTPDRSVAEVVRARFGTEVLERLVDPLLGGIHAGRSEDLSLASVAAPVAEAAASGGSLMRALRRRPAAAPGPVFQTVRPGLCRMIESLVGAGPGLSLGVGVTGIERTGVGGYAVITGEAEAIAADAVVVATPASVAARLLAGVAPRAAQGLAMIDYSSVATLTLAYRPQDVGHDLDGSGFLVPRVENRTITACTWLTSKWAHLDGGGKVLLRASVGRQGDDSPLELDDADLVARAHHDLTDILGLSDLPVDHRVDRWPDALPQYRVGHAERVRAIGHSLAGEAAGLILTGAAYDGLGIAACVASAQRAAAAVEAHLDCEQG